MELATVVNIFAEEFKLPRTSTMSVLRRIVAAALAGMATCNA
jgi:hypothetical protein